MPREYNSGTSGDSSSIDSSKDQINQHYYEKMALIEARKEQYFSQLADVTSMPKNMGKTIKRYHYIPMLDVQNLNDQGIDAAGIAQLITERMVTFPRWDGAGSVDGTAMYGITTLDAAAAAAVVTINTNTNTAAKGAQVIASAGIAGSGGAGRTLITITVPMARYATSVTAGNVAALNAGVTVEVVSGNLYASSKDIGTISGKLPALSETGGRVNRVGFKRKELEGTLEKFGFFDEYTQESLDFDSDAELMQHISREMVNGANEITEDALQIDLINAAGVIKYAGNATNMVTMDTADIVAYGDLMRLSIDLDNNRTPKHTKVITGTRMVDTKTLPAARVMYIGSEMLPTLKTMVDSFSNQAFISVEKYAAGGTTLVGEVGAIDQFRVVVVPEMMKWAGAGSLSSGDADKYETNDRYDVFPMLVVGSESFTTIGFQTDGKSVKFKITHKAPGEATADRNDPYGETGFMSIKWYYGFMALRPERIAVLKTVAKL